MLTCTEVVAIWDELTANSDVGDLTYCDLERAVNRVVGVNPDIGAGAPVSDATMIPSGEGEGG